MAAGVGDIIECLPECQIWAGKEDNNLKGADIPAVDIPAVGIHPECLVREERDKIRIYLSPEVIIHNLQALQHIRGLSIQCHLREEKAGEVLPFLSLITKVAIIRADITKVVIISLAPRLIMEERRICRIGLAVEAVHLICMALIVHITKLTRATNLISHHLISHHPINHHLINHRLISLPLIILSHHPMMAEAKEVTAVSFPAMEEECLNLQYILPEEECRELLEGEEVKAVMADNFPLIAFLGEEEQIPTLIKQRETLETGLPGRLYLLMVIMDFRVALHLILAPEENGEEEQIPTLIKQGETLTWAIVLFSRQEEK
tara:strand:- start:162 stop:1118 length:957 start_codon:yes stop_codon:yes gene_type:complete